MAALGVSQSTARELLQPEVLSHLKNLDLVARSVVEGFLIGLHRSPKFGFSQEFAEYRAYAEGDDPRFIDWNRSLCLTSAVQMPRQSCTT